MAIHKQARNGVWYARDFQNTPDGQRIAVQRSLGIKVVPGSAKFADRAIARITGDILAGKTGAGAKAGVDPTEATVAEAVRIYVTRLNPPGRTAQGIASSWARASGATRLRALTVSEIESFASAVTRRKTAARSTIASRLIIVRAVLREAARHGMAVPELDLRIRRPRSYAPRWMTIEDRDWLLACCDPFWRPFVTMLFYTGARPVELGRLRWRDVPLPRDGAYARVHLRDRKGRPPEWVERAVQIHDAVLAEMPERRRSDAHVFLDEVGRPLVTATEQEDFTTSARHQLRQAFNAALLAAGLQHMTPYWARHTFASRIVQQTGNLQAAADLLGHTSLAMVSKHYGRQALRTTCGRELRPSDRGAIGVRGLTRKRTCLLRSGLTVRCARRGRDRPGSTRRSHPR